MRHGPNRSLASDVWRQKRKKQSQKDSVLMFLHFYNRALSLQRQNVFSTTLSPPSTYTIEDIPTSRVSFLTPRSLWSIGADKASAIQNCCVSYVINTVICLLSFACISVCAILLVLNGSMYI